MAKNPTKCKFDYLRNWIDTGSAVNLECTASRSGMSMAVYCREERIFTVHGCGFDRIGTAIGYFLEPLFQAELRATMSPSTIKGPYANGYHPCELYGATRSPSGFISLNGACGVSSMRAIAEAIGLEVTTESLRNSTRISIKKKRKP